MASLLRHTACHLPSLSTVIMEETLQDAVLDRPPETFLIDAWIKGVCEKCCGASVSFVFVLEDSGWSGGAAPGRLFSAPLRKKKKAGRSAALPREPSGGRKRQGSTADL